MPTPFRLLLLLFLVLASISGGQSYSNITRGTVPLLPRRLQPLPLLHCRLFAATSPQSVVWSAKLASGATVRLTADGRLSLRSENGSETWTAASVLDTGNLVLADATGVLWQSFDDPTDALLPGQVPPEGASQRSQLTDADFSEGRFSLMAQADGNLVL